MTPTELERELEREDALSPFPSTSCPLPQSSGVPIFPGLTSVLLPPDSITSDDGGDPSQPYVDPTPLYKRARTVSSDEVSLFSDVVDPHAREERRQER